MNNNDWDEIKKWNIEKEKEEKEKYGSKLSDLNTYQNNKRVNKFVKLLKSIGNIFKAISIILFSITFFVIFIIATINFNNINSKTNVDVKQAIEPRYNIKIKVIDKQVDDKKNGKYFLCVKDNPEIKFTAIKQFGNLTEDYSTRTHKYYFEKWQSSNKNYFKVEENIDNDILSYSTYLDIDDFENVDIATNKIIEFADYCGNNFMPSWKIYEKKGGVEIYPYQSSNTTKEEAMNNAKQLYQRYFQK